jgi:transposase InsO family protein
MRAQANHRLAGQAAGDSMCGLGVLPQRAGIHQWCDSKLGGRVWGIRLEHIQPGNPQQNAYVERFNRTVRYEWLSQHDWKDLAQVQDFATQWKWSYNHDRPNMALGGFTPKKRLAMAA